MNAQTATATPAVETAAPVGVSGLAPFAVLPNNPNVTAPEGYTIITRMSRGAAKATSGDKMVLLPALTLPELAVGVDSEEAASAAVAAVKATLEDAHVAMVREAISKGATAFADDNSQTDFAAVVTWINTTASVNRLTGKAIDEWLTLGDLAAVILQVNPKLAQLPAAQQQQVMGGVVTKFKQLAAVGAKLPEAEAGKMIGWASQCPDHPIRNAVLARLQAMLESNVSLEGLE